MPARFLDGLPVVGGPGIVLESPNTQNDLETSLHETDDIVVSGISCRLPESDNMAEFREHLVNGEDMVTEDGRRWTPGLYGLPKRNGKLKDLTKFDAAFFGVHPKQADSMDPQLRMLLEVAYESIVDAGVDPLSVRGSRTGVFIGCSASESHDNWTGDFESIGGYEMTGCTRSMFANRLSYFFDFKGPSFAIDTACSSSLLALDQAVRAIRSGQCEAAIVGGSSLCLRPHTALQFLKLGMLSPDGTCKSFDEAGNGYCRSEGVVVIYIQKCCKAKRLYATVVHSKTNSDGSKEQGITFPSGEIQKQLLEDVYSECGVDPATVAYVEAHGTGTKAGDPQELNTITDVFCKKGRQGPLLIGSVKSNMGHPEPASGLAAVAKVLIGMEDGYLPANLHYHQPNPDIPGLVDGRLKVVSEHTKWDGGYVAINSFGFGGSNVHVLLQSNKGPNQQIVVEEIPQVPRLIVTAGRTKECVECVLKGTQSSNSVHLESLVQATASVPCSVHPHRGYTISGTNNTAMEIQKCSPDRRPVWFVFAGMGTQWHGMGRDLMSLKVFKDSIMRTDEVLKPYGMKFYEMLMNADENTFNDSLSSFVGIAGIQVALVDILKSVGITPDGIVGHSVGELGCAYADGCLTAEQTVLAAYWRGRCVQEANLPAGGMAAVGLTWEEAKQRCPDKVVPACHNATDTVTLSGPAKEISEFVAQLQSEGIFAKEVKSAGVAFHSYCMLNTAPALLTALKKVIPIQSPRTERWISSSIPESQWHTSLAKTSSAEYHVNNLVSPVLFQEALQHVPDNAVTVEIAPHGLLQAILKRSLSPECVFVSTMKRFHKNNHEFLLSNLGKLYMAGVDLDMSILGAVPVFPVPRGTPMISPMLRWDHSASWRVPTPEEMTAGSSNNNSSSCTYRVSIEPDSDDHFLEGHRIDGRVLYPATGYLVLAWRTLAKITGHMYQDMPVEFKDVHIHRATIMPKSGSVQFEVGITPGTGHFEVCEGSVLVVSGEIHAAADPVLQIPVRHVDVSQDDEILLPLLTSDVYKELRLRGYDYGPTFQGILSASNRGDHGSLRWLGEWISFLDTMLQIQVLGQPGGGLRLPTRITTLRIDPRKHLSQVVHLDDNSQGIRVSVDRTLNACTSGGVEILGLHATVAPKRQIQQSPILEKYEFVPYNEENLGSLDEELCRYADSCRAYCEQSIKLLLERGKHPNMELLNKLNVLCSDCNNLPTKRDIDERISKNNEKHSLLSELQRIFHAVCDETCMENVQRVLDTCPDLYTDRLCGAFLQPRILKPCLDIVMENSCGPRLKVVEFCHSAATVHKYVLQLLQTQPLQEVNRK